MSPAEGDAAPAAGDASKPPEHRRYDRLRAALEIRYRPMSAEESARGGEGFVPPQTFKGNSAETRDLNRLVTEDSTTSEDISLGGVKISTPQELPVGTRLWLEVHLPDVPIPVSAMGEVRWSHREADHFSSGLKFTGISRADLEKVDRFLVLQKRAQIAKRG